MNSRFTKEEVEALEPLLDLDFPPDIEEGEDLTDGHKPEARTLKRR